MGIGSLAYVYIDSTRTIYSETLFSEESKLFNESFLGFTDNVDKNIQLIRSSFNNLENIRDTVKTQEFFLKYMEENPFLMSVLLFQNDYKIGVNRDNKSVVYASDSTSIDDRVRWRRFENGQFISSWEESFEYRINETPWYKKLKNNINQIQWFFQAGLKENDNNELFYAGYSYENEGGISIVLLRFERSKLTKNFKVFSKFEKVNLLVRTSDNKTMDLSSKSLNTFREIEAADQEVDSLSIHTIRHFKKFDDEDKGIFNFRYKEEVYWNSFQRFPMEEGILFYLLTIPDNQIQSALVNSTSKILFWIGLVLVLIGVLSLFAKSRIFYKWK